MENLDDEKMKEELNEPLATEILRELKTQNRRIMRVVYALMATVILVVGGFLVYMYQYDFSSYDINSSDGGYANYIGSDGDIYNGESASPSPETERQKG